MLYIHIPFSVSWSRLIEEADDLPSGAILVTPLSHKRFRITDVQDQRIIIEFEDGESRPLQRDQFETLYRRIADTSDGFDLSRLPPDADPFPAVWSLHPRFEIDENDGMIRLTEGPTPTQVIDQGEPEDETARTEPDVSVYS